uniref:Uncharacterized protein n=1 Tax=Romanomermis culicivorax TaxID=13658 RepID=A0A915I133_ROMCU
MVEIEGGENQYICLWQTCTKYRKDGKPFPSLPRLNRHMKEKHVQVQSSTKCMLPSAVGRNFVSSSVLNDDSAHAAIFAAHGQSSNHSTSSGSFIQSSSVAAGKIAPAAASVAFPQQQQQTFVAPNNQNGIGGAQSTARFQTPPPQLGVTATNTVLVDSQGNIISSGQPYNVYHIQQSVVPNPQPMGSILEQPTQEQQAQQQKQSIPESGRLIVKSQRIAEPIFVIPPQRVQRVLHSEVYLQYLENLNKSQPEPSVSRWDRYLAATPQNTKPPGGVPADTFFDRNGNEPYARGNKDELNQALWNLRNHLMYDNLGLYKILNIDEM